MAQEVGKELVRTFRPFDLVDLSPADPAVVHLDQDLSERQMFRQVEIAHHEGLVELDEDGGAGPPGASQACQLFTRNK